MYTISIDWNMHRTSKTTEYLLLGIDNERPPLAIGDNRSIFKGNSICWQTLAGHLRVIAVVREEIKRIDTWR